MLYFDLKNEKDYQYLSTLYNYCNALLKNKQLEKIIPIINENEELIKQSNIEIYFITLRINIHLLKDEYQELEKYLPNEFNDLPLIFVIHFKIVQAWLFFKQGDIGLALNELSNFNRTYRKMHDCEDYVEIANMFVKYFRLFTESKPIQHKRIEKLEKEIINFRAIKNEALNHYSPLLWLQKQLKI